MVFLFTTFVSGIPGILDNICHRDKHWPTSKWVFARIAFSPDLWFMIASD
jgi:hypothetical protein